jgi:hypothetical protein
MKVECEPVALFLRVAAGALVIRFVTASRSSGCPLICAGETFAGRRKGGCGGVFSFSTPGSSQQKASR